MREGIRGNPRVLADIRAAVRGERSASAPVHDIRINRTIESSPRDALTDRFMQEARAVGMFGNTISRLRVMNELDSLIRAGNAGPVLLERSLARNHPELLSLPRVRTDPTEDETFTAAIGIVGAAAGIAETGSIVRFSSPDTPRSFALAPWALIVLLEIDRIVPDLYDWIGSLDPKSMASEIVLITGPSKSADIGMQLVTGVHGPGEVRILLLSGD